MNKKLLILYLNVTEAEISPWEDITEGQPTGQYVWFLNLGSRRGEGRRGNKQRGPSPYRIWRESHHQCDWRSSKCGYASDALRFMLRIPSGNVVVSLLLSWRVSDSSWWEGEREDLPGKWQNGDTGNMEMVQGNLKKILCPRSWVKKRFLVGFREVTDSRLS